MVDRRPSGSQVRLSRYRWSAPITCRSSQFEMFFPAPLKSGAPTPGTGTRAIRAQYASRMAAAQSARDFQLFVYR
jgi:hypothetical protein